MGLERDTTEELDPYPVMTCRDDAVAHQGEAAETMARTHFHLVLLKTRMERNNRKLSTL
jgi:hypothetical protein